MGIQQVGYQRVMINGFTFAYELTTTHLEVVSYMAFFTNQKEFKDILQTIGFFFND